MAKGEQVQAKPNVRPTTPQPIKLSHSQDDGKPGSSPSSMSSSVLLCPSAMATLPLITGLAGILGGSSVSPAVQSEKQHDKTVWITGYRGKRLFNWKKAG